MINRNAIWFCVDAVKPRFIESSDSDVPPSN